MVEPTVESPDRSRAPLSTSATRQALSLSGFVVTYSGNLDLYQDIDILTEGFERFARVSGTTVMVIVTHDKNWRFEAPAKLLKLEATGLVRVVVAESFSQVSEILASSDVLVLPRSSWSGFPMKLLNYQRAGRAILAAEGSAKNIRPGFDGIVFANRNSHKLAKSLDLLYRDRELREKIGRSAYDRAMALPSEGLAGRMHKIYRGLVPRPSLWLSGQSTLKAIVSRALIGFWEGNIRIVPRHDQR